MSLCRVTTYFRAVLGRFRKGVEANCSKTTMMLLFRF